MSGDNTPRTPESSPPAAPAAAGTTPQGDTILPTPRSSSPDRPALSQPVRVARLLVGALGLAVIAYGVAGLLDEPAYVDRRGVLRWLVAGLLVHDLLFAAVVFAVGRAALRARPGRGPAPWVRRTLLGGVAAGVAATLTALPALLRPGTPPNPSVLPLDYGRNLALVWAGIAVATGVVLVIRRRRYRKRA